MIDDYFVNISAPLHNELISIAIFLLALWLLKLLIDFRDLLMIKSSIDSGRVIKLQQLHRGITTMRLSLSEFTRIFKNELSHETIQDVLQIRTGTLIDAQSVQKISNPESAIEFQVRVESESVLNVHLGVSKSKWMTFVQEFESAIDLFDEIEEDESEPARKRFKSKKMTVDENMPLLPSECAIEMESINKKNPHNMLMKYGSTHITDVLDASFELENVYIPIPSIGQGSDDIIVLHLHPKTPMQKQAREILIFERDNAWKVSFHCILHNTGIYEIQDIYGLDHEHEREDCIACLQERKNVIILPCRHCCVCYTCFQRVDKCPVCRTSVEAHIRPEMDAVFDSHARFGD